MYRSLLLSLVLIGCQLANAQRIQLGGIAAVGSKSVYNEWGIGPLARFGNHVEVNLGFSYGRYNGVGFTTGLTYHVLKTRLSPFVGIEYSKSHGIGNITLHYNSYSSEIRIGTCEFLVPKVGLTLKVREENMIGSGEGFWTFCVSNRQITYSSSPVRFLDANMPADEQNYFKQRVGSGWGFFIGYTLLFDIERK